MIGTFTAQWVIKELKAWNDEKVWNKTTALMLSSVILFFGGLTINIYALVKNKDLYVGVFLGFIFFVLLQWVSSNIHGMSSLALDFAGCNNRTILGFYSFGGCYFCLRNFLLGDLW